MVTINNQELKKAFSDSTKTQLSEQPNQVDNKVVIPIIDLTPKKHKIVTEIIKTATATNATTATVYTTPSNQDFYLTGFNLSMIKDVTSTSTQTGLIVRTGGADRRIANIVGITLTVQNSAISNDLSIPVKIDRGTSIIITNGTAVANVVGCACIYGYLEDAQ